MKKILKTILLGLSLLVSISSFANTPQSGDTLEVSVDWDRIERGLKTGDFSCKGTCATISIDWKETWLTVTGQKYRNQKKRDMAYCISEYQKSKNSFDDIAEMEETGDITTTQASRLTKMHESSLSSVEMICVSRLGERKANNLRESILGFYK